MTPGVQVLAAVPPDAQRVLDPMALAFVADLAREFESTRRMLLRARAQRQAEIDGGRLPDFLPETQGIRSGEWRVAPAPRDLQDRRVEITGPAGDRKMVINALNSGSQVYMADFEDAQSPGWRQCIEGQVNVSDAARGAITYASPDRIEYRLGERTAALSVRPRGLHLVERHVLVDGQPVAASFFDLGLALCHNAGALLERGSAPHFYLPKLQGHLEARLWNELVEFSERRLGLPRGSTKVTVLIEHILAAFEMEEILYELRDHAAGLNLGRWDYIFSFIKTFRNRSEAVLPDRARVTMATAFLLSAAELLVQVCHRRGAHAIGGMSAFIPRKADAQTERVLAQVRADKQREASKGFDGAWVAHPAFVPLVHEVFEAAFTGPNQLRHAPQTRVTAGDLLRAPEGEITEEGVSGNVGTALQYLEAWLQGRGAVAINGLMEDTATAEISRAQLWQWLRHRAHLAGGEHVTQTRYLDIRAEQVALLLKGRADSAPGALDKAVDLLDHLVLNDSMPEFLTIDGYRYLD